MNHVERPHLLSRRQLLLAAASALSSACRAPASKQSVLADLVGDVLVPASRAVVSSSTALEKSAAELAERPGAEALGVCRKQWCSALLSWKRLYCFRNGPFVETSALYRACFWPVRPPGIESALGAATPIDELAIETLGADQKGLYALEYLLFGADGSADILPSLSGPSRARRRELLRAAARNVATLAGKGSASLGDGAEYAKTFAAGGQDSLNRLVNQLVETIEGTYEHLTRVKGLNASGLLRSAEIEAWPSAQSHEIFRTQVDETSRMYWRSGRPGLGDLVRAKSPAIDDHVRSALTKMQQATAALDMPLERLVRRDPARLDALVEAMKGLEVAFKVDLPSALGVTLTFTAGDGD